MADGDSPLWGLSQRLPPSNLQAEQALLGALLSNNRAYERVAEFLEPQHFADPINGFIYKRICERLLDGRLADAVTLRQDFDERGMLAEVGGNGYLAQLLSAMVGIATAGEYGRAIVDCWKRRRLIQIGEDIVNGAFGLGASVDADSQIEHAERSLGEINSTADHRGKLVSGGAAIRTAIDRAMDTHRTGMKPGIVFGIPTLDRALEGLVEPGTLTLLAGLPGSGKTGLAGQMGLRLGMRVATEAAHQGLPPDHAERRPGMLLISMEMSAEEVGIRLAALESGLTISSLRKGEIDIAATMNLSRTIDVTRHIPFRIHDMIGMPYRLAIPKIMMHLQRQPELVVAFDHILVMGEDDSAGDRGKRQGLDAASVGWLTRNLKKLARRLNVAIVALTHTPRPKEGIIRRPISSDVKWAGEGDADNIVFVHRPIMTMSDQPPPRGRLTEEAYRGPNGPLTRWEYERKALEEVAEIVVTKARQGPGGVYRMRWHGPTTSLREWREDALMEVPSEFDMR